LTEPSIRKYLGFAIGLAMLVTACTGQPGTPSTGADAADPNGVVTTNTGTEPNTIDPNLASFSTEIEQIMSVYEGLMTLDPKTLKPIPAAASKDPEVSADGLTWKVTIRDGLKYSDGTPLTAANYVYGFKRTCDIDIDYGFVLTVVKGCDDLGAMDHKKATAAELKAAWDKIGITANGDKEIVFTLTEPAAYFASILYMWVGMPVRESDVTKGGERWTENPATYIGNGPWIMKEWKHNERFVYEPNPNYRLGKPKIAKWTRVMIADSSVAFAAYRNNELDEYAVVAEDLRAILADADLSKQIVDRVAAITNYYGFNVTRPPFNDPNVRLAFAKGFDREAYTKDILGGIGKSANNGFIPPGIPGFDESDNIQKYDVTAAKALLDKATPEAKAALGSIKFTYQSTARLKTRAEWIQQQWEKNLPGVKIALDPVDPSAFSGLFKGGASGQSPQVFTLGWIADYPDQQNFHTVVWISKEGVSSRRTGFSNPKFDTLVRDADKEKDKAKRDAAYLEAGKILSQDAPAAWLNYAASKFLRKPWIKGVVDSSIDSVMGQFKQTEIFITKRT
jgi:oligopeptide transport system substrate-binding protein